ncbi:SMEK domain-containing protein [Paenibacillus sp. 276b]|uniref:SMEK domain-containing protein n=1 Tax=Paenibacillus sp. 276b TaxID=1566277 RepID=UPI00089A2B3F|nr:SMEK domain-containing protein [Paenibacillus sp. 276b]SEB27705.1 hypothetical protein SAMN03159332_6383 [Paenibacillus sp. 276b]
MALRRMEDLNDIMKGLSLLQYYIKFSSNKLRNHSINEQCETFFAGLLNRMYDLKLVTLGKNHPAIDLEDKKNHYAVQITTDGTKKKLNHTVSKFEGKKYYKKYATLLHLIVGEKGFLLPKDNPYPFQNGQFSNYYADVKDDKEYQIIIQDLYGLILEIDALDDETLGDLRKYINKNINSVIDAVRQPFYEHIPATVSPYTAVAFFKHFDMTDINHQQEFIQQMDKFSDVLAGLDKNTRIYLYYATQSLRPESSKHGWLIVSEPTLRKKLKLNIEEAEEEIEVLESVKLLNRDIIQDNQAFVLHYYDEDGVELINDLFQFCKENDRSLEKIIVDLNISELD